MGVKNDLLYDGISILYTARNSDTVLIDNSGAFLTAPRDVEFVSVPGRNGDLSFDNGRYENISVTYTISVSNKASYFHMVRNIIERGAGYHKLKDTAGRRGIGTAEEVFRLAQFVSATNLETTQFNDGGTFELTFNCKPQLFLESGDEWKTITTPYNAFSDGYQQYGNALPLFYVVGNGTLTIAPVHSYDEEHREMQSFTVSGRGTNQITIIDSDLQDCYSYASNPENLNQYVTFSNGFPYLNNYSANLTFTGFSEVQLKKRTWVI